MRQMSGARISREWNRCSCKRKSSPSRCRAYRTDARCLCGGREADGIGECTEGGKRNRRNAGSSRNRAFDPDVGSSSHCVRVPESFVFSSRFRTLNSAATKHWNSTQSEVRKAWADQSSRKVRCKSKKYSAGSGAVKHRKAWRVRKSSGTKLKQARDLKPSS